MQRGTRFGIRTPVALLAAAALTSVASASHLGRMWLCEEEQLILKYLRLLRGGAATPREICRKASTKDRWKENERWAIPFLQRLRDKGLVGTTEAGLFRLLDENAGE